MTNQEPAYSPMVITLDNGITAWRQGCACVMGDFHRIAVSFSRMTKKPARDLSPRCDGCHVPFLLLERGGFTTEGAKQFIKEAAASIGYITTEANPKPAPPDGPFDLFCSRVKAVLEKKADKKGYAKVQGGINDPSYANPLLHFVEDHFHGHALGEVVYKAVRAMSLKLEEDLVKIAAWVYLVWWKEGHHLAKGNGETRTTTSVEPGTKVNFPSECGACMEEQYLVPSSRNVALSHTCLAKLGQGVSRS